MLGRYDTLALKCQDIFSVHGFPVGLVQCENNLLGIKKVRVRSFPPLSKKYRRAKKVHANDPLKRGMTENIKRSFPSRASDWRPA